LCRHYFQNTPCNKAPNSNTDYTNGAKMSKPSEHFISHHFLTAVNQGGRIEKAEKSQHFSILMKWRKVDKTREISRFDFFTISEIKQ